MSWLYAERKGKQHPVRCAQCKNPANGRYGDPANKHKTKALCSSCATKGSWVKL